MRHKNRIRALSMLLSLLMLSGCAAAPTEQTPADLNPQPEPSDALPTQPSETDPTEAPTEETEKPEPAVSEQPAQAAAVAVLAQPLPWDLKMRQALTPTEAEIAFWKMSTTQFLSDTAGENRVFSPLNVYLALAMLAETTEGESRQQLLSVLGEDCVEELRQEAQKLWERSNLHTDDAVVALANSFWARNDIPYKEQTMQTLAESYYASAFAGEMGSEAYNRALQDWLNEQTGSLLREQAANQEMNVNTVLALVSTLYFKDSWNQQFSKESMTEDVFHAPEGDVPCIYLHETTRYVFYRFRNFTAIGKLLNEAGTMYFLLPNPGVEPEDLLQDEQALRFLGGEVPYDQGSSALVRLTLPKFDVSSGFDLTEGLKAMGVTDVFDETRADFSPLTPAARDLYVSAMDHAGRVQVDENGCEAAAYTMIRIDTKTAVAVQLEVDFTVDRPFLFTLLSSDNVPLFTGIVNRPGTVA